MHRHNSFKVLNFACIYNFPSLIYIIRRWRSTWFQWRSELWSREFTSSPKFDWHFCLYLSKRDKKESSSFCSFFFNFVTLSGYNPSTYPEVEENRFKAGSILKCLESVRIVLERLNIDLNNDFTKIIKIQKIPKIVKLWYKAICSIQQSYSAGDPRLMKNVP